MVDARQEAIDELEDFEKDYKDSFDDENFDNESVVAADLDVSSQKPEPEGEEPEGEQEAVVDTPEVVAEVPDQEIQKPKMVTLPEDAAAFGEFAGKKISYEELSEAGLVDKLVTWGHQGRHMTQKGQEDLEEARKMRELLEEQLALQKAQVEQANRPPDMTPEQHSEQLVNKYGPEIEAFAKAGGIEHGFFDNYPKVASYLENRLQAAAQLGDILIQEVDKLKKGHDTWTERDASEQGKSRLRTVSEEAGGTIDALDFLKTDEGYNDFMKWATAEDSTLHWVDRDVEHVTVSDIQASALLYIQQNPEKFTKKKSRAKATPEEKQLAGGAGGGKNTELKAVPTNDEITNFQKEFAESFQGQEY